MSAAALWMFCSVLLQLRELYWFYSDDQLTGIFPFVQGNGHTLIYCIDFWVVNQWDLKTGVSSLITGGAQLLSWVGGWVRQQLTKPTGSSGLWCCADRILKVFFSPFSQVKVSVCCLCDEHQQINVHFLVCKRSTCKSACRKNLWKWMQQLFFSLWHFVVAQ